MVPLSVLQSILAKKIAAPEFIELKGDASDRKFVRMLFKDSGIGKTKMLMVYPEGFDPGRLNYIDVQGFLKKIGIPVPEVDGVSGKHGLVVLEDLGDITMEMELKGEPARKEILYKEAVELLVKMQLNAMEAGMRDCVAFTLEFDVPKFMFELDFFRYHYIERMCSRKISSSDLTCFEKSFKQLSKLLADYPEKVFCHRDYHTRNLMVTDRGLYMVDFQDARLGLPQYDLASLLRDSYAGLEMEFAGKMLEHYLETRAASGIAVEDNDEFRRFFNLASLQRNLKAVGTFAFQKVEKKNDRYINYIPLTLSYVKNNRLALDELPELGGLLNKYVLQ